jgi:hypothetical protein
MKSSIDGLDRQPPLNKAEPSPSLPWTVRTNLREFWIRGTLQPGLREIVIE